MPSPMVARIDPYQCDRSPFCPAARICPADAIVPQAQGLLHRGFPPLAVDATRCTGCGRCTRNCPHQAISMVPREAATSDGTESPAG